MDKYSKTTNETRKHIINVIKFINQIVVDLIARGSAHDASKLETPEVEEFDKYTAKLATLTYNGPEYKQCLNEMKLTLEHHYAHNRHHPEHFKNGIKDMTLMDLMEMIADWKAASMRHNDGNIRKSIDDNATRFNFSDELKQILHNTIDYLRW